VDRTASPEKDLDQDPRHFLGLEVVPRQKNEARPEPCIQDEDHCQKLAEINRLNRKSVGGHRNWLVWLIYTPSS
jgi:hypothetical protein